MNLTTIYENIKNEIKIILPKKRYEHSINVEFEAIKLAQIYGCDVEKARVAGIAHDFAKFYSSNDLIKIAQNYGIQIDEIQYNSPQLLHGQVASQICMDKYEVKDQDILNAIRYHTTGRKGMTLLEKIIFLADVIEPGRNFPGINDIRELATRDIEGSLLLACNYTLIFITEQNFLIHPLTIEFRNSLLLKGGEVNER